MGREVVIVVSSEFATMLEKLALSNHVWAVRTPEMEMVARRIWGEHPPGEVDVPTSGVTLFTGTGDAEDDLLSIIDAVELHHGIAGGGDVPAVTTVRVLGVAPTVVIRDAFGTLGFTRIMPIANGFVAHWNL